MNKDVLVSIFGLQFESTGDDAIEMIIPGNYYKKMVSTMLSSMN